MRSLRLREVLEDDFVVTRDDLVPHDGSASLKVNIGPPQAERFAPATSGRCVEQPCG